MVFPPGATAKADLQPQLSKKRTGTPRNTSRKKSKHHVEIAADDDSGGMRKGGDGLVFPPGAIAQADLLPQRSKKRTYTPSDTSRVPCRTSSRKRIKRVIQEATSATPTKRGPRKRSGWVQVGQLADCPV